MCTVIQERAETRLKVFLEGLEVSDNFPRFIHNRHFTTGVRPDFIWETRDMVFIIECDENQHRWTYGHYTEAGRNMQILSKCRGKPLVVMRFNPDIFVVEGEIMQVDESIRHGHLKDLVALIGLAPEPPTHAFTEYKLFFDNEHVIDENRYIQVSRWETPNEYWESFLDP